MNIEDIIRQKFIFSSKIDFCLSLKLIATEDIKKITDIAGADRREKTPNLK